jgi:hypothetical protein
MTESGAIPPAPPEGKFASIASAQGTERWMRADQKPTESSSESNIPPLCSWATDLDHVSTEIVAMLAEACQADALAHLETLEPSDMDRVSYRAEYGDTATVPHSHLRVPML